MASNGSGTHHPKDTKILVASEWIDFRDNIFSKCITVLDQALAAARYLKRDTHFCCKWWMCYCAQLITRSFSSTLHSSVQYWEGCKQIIPIGREDDDEPSAHCAELKWCIHFHCVRIWLIVFHSLLRGLTIDSIVQNFVFFCQRHKLENLKHMLTWGICFKM